MKTSFISSNAIQNAMRLTIRQTQNQMSEASEEATTGIYADIGISLGGKTAQSVDFNRELTRIDSILDSNSIAAGRLSASQTALTNMSGQAQDFLDQLLALRGNQTSDNVTLSQNTADTALSALVGASNTMVNGEYIFAGINTDVQPMTDNSDAAVTAIDDALTTYMAGLSPPVTSTADLTNDQMTDFIKTQVEPMFTDDTSPAPNWTSWSSASDQNMTSRISNSEVVDSSANTNGDGMRYLALATSVTKALMDKDLSSDTMNAVTDAAISYSRQSVDALNATASELGLSQSRVTKANDTLNAQKDIINNNIADLQGVDPYEASTKANALQTQLETAYTLVSKIQQLSLVNYL